MTNYLLSKGYKYYVRLSGSGQPVLGSMIARKTPPRRSNGTWADITSCLYGCCNPNSSKTFSVDTSSIGIEFSGTEGPFNVYALSGITPVNGDVVTFAPLSTTIGATTVNLLADGTLTLSAPSGTSETFTLVVLAKDDHGNTATITITIYVSVA